MTKFFIIGDSWGVGEWERPNGVFNSVPNTGIDYYLRQHGHQVTNVSAGGAGNFGQLRHGYWTLKDKHKYDYIIWFHTETMRDIEEIIIKDPEEGHRQFPEFVMENFNTAIRYINRENYRYAQSMSDEYGIPFIVIGGHSPVDSIIYEFTFAHHVILSWLQELLDLDFVPSTNSLFTWKNVKRILDHYNIRDRDFILENEPEIDQATKITELVTKSTLFPDNIHPSRQCFEQLAFRILEMVKHDQQS